MSDSDSFISEVSEEVRRDRMFALWRKYGPFLIGAIALIVAAAGLKAYLDAEERAAAQQAGGALIAASEGDLDEQAAALAALAESSDHEGARLLAELRVAGVLAAEGDSAAAAEAYDRIAASASLDLLIRDFATYRAVMLRGAEMESAAFADALSSIANGSGPFRLLAMEARGIALVRAGDQQAGEDELRAAHSDEAAPQALRQRIEVLMTALGGSLDN